MKEIEQTLLCKNQKNCKTDSSRKYKNPISKNFLERKKITRNNTRKKPKIKKKLQATKKNGKAKIKQASYVSDRELLLTALSRDVDLRSRDKLRDASRQDDDIDGNARDPRLRNYNHSRFKVIW